MNIRTDTQAQALTLTLKHRFRHAFMRHDTLPHPFPTHVPVLDLPFLWRGTGDIDAAHWEDLGDERTKVCAHRA